MTGTPDSAAHRGLDLQHFSFNTEMVKYVIEDTFSETLTSSPK